MAVQVFGFVVLVTLCTCAMMSPVLATVKVTDNYVNSTSVNYKDVVVSSHYTLPTSFKDLIKSNEVIREGFSSGIAGSVQVLTLMWLRTVNSYQSTYNAGMIDTIKLLYNEGGIARFYQGLNYAILQNPLSRMGSVVSNNVAEKITSYNEEFRLSAITEYDGIVSSISDGVAAMSPAAIGSILSGIWRAILMPLDTIKVCV